MAGSEVEFWTALAFGETEQAALLGLAEGEKCTVQGSMKLKVKVGDGDVKIYKTVFVDALLALKPAPRERKPSNAAAKRDTASAPARADFDDGLPEQWGARSMTDALRLLDPRTIEAAHEADIVALANELAQS